MEQLTTSILKVSVSDAPVEPAPIPDQDIISGAPDSTMAILWRSEDNKDYNGVWHCTPGVFMLTHPAETICLVEGSATLRAVTDIVLSGGPRHDEATRVS